MMIVKKISRDSDSGLCPPLFIDGSRKKQWQSSGGLNTILFALLPFLVCLHVLSMSVVQMKSQHDLLYFSPTL